jgi:hypothetical protein
LRLANAERAMARSEQPHAIFRAATTRKKDVHP